jgi:hypothetical protein
MSVWLSEICVSRLRGLKVGLTTWPDRRAWLSCDALLVWWLLFGGHHLFAGL